MVSFFLKLCIFTKWPNASKWFCTEGFPVIFHDRLWLCSNPWPYILELGSHVFRLPASNTGTLDLTLSNSPARIWSVCPCGTHSFRLLNPEVWLKVERPYGLSGKFAHWRSLRERTKLPSKNGTRTWHLKDSTNQLSEKSVPKPLPPLFRLKIEPRHDTLKTQLTSWVKNLSQSPYLPSFILSVLFIDLLFYIII